MGRDGILQLVHVMQHGAPEDEELATGAVGVGTIGQEEDGDEEEEEEEEIEQDILTAEHRGGDVGEKVGLGGDTGAQQDISTSHVSDFGFGPFEGKGLM